MGVVTSREATFRFIRESSPGVPETTGARVLEVNEPGEVGSTITVTPRNPISARRSRRKGKPTSEEASMGFEADLTLDAFTDFAEGFVFAEWVNSEFLLRSAGGPPVPTATGYTIDAASALLAGKVQFNGSGGQTLVYGLGYSTAANNGLKVLTADLATSGTEITVSGLTAEPSPPANADLQVCGLRTDDLTLVVSGSTATLTSAGDIDFTTIGLTVGCEIHIGSPDANGDVQNAFDDTGTDDVFGFARVTNITATELTLDKLVGALLNDGTYTPETVDILIGRFLRDVPVEADADDNRYLRQTNQFEIAFPNLGTAGATEYEYVIGGTPNELALNQPLQELATANWGFIALSSDPITPTRKTGFSTAVEPLRTAGISTAADVASISTDAISAASDVCLQNATFTLSNGVQREFCQGQLGASSTNPDQFSVTMEGTLLFTDKNIINAIRANDTLTFQSILSNEDGAICIDIPALTFQGGGREFPLGQSVRVNVTGDAFADPSGPVPDTSIGVTVFATVPS
jgi:hypothetical protein